MATKKTQNWQVERDGSMFIVARGDFAAGGVFTHPILASRLAEKLNAKASA